LVVIDGWTSQSDARGEASTGIDIDCHIGWTSNRWHLVVAHNDTLLASRGVAAAVGRCPGHQIGAGEELCRSIAGNRHGAAVVVGGRTAQRDARGEASPGVHIDCHLGWTSNRWHLVVPHDDTLLASRGVAAAVGRRPGHQIGASGELCRSIAGNRHSAAVVVGGRTAQWYASGKASTGVHVDCHIGWTSNRWHLVVAHDDTLLASRGVAAAVVGRPGHQIGAGGELCRSIAGNRYRAAVVVGGRTAQWYPSGKASTGVHVDCHI